MFGVKLNIYTCMGNFYPIEAVGRGSETQFPPKIAQIYMKSLFLFTK